MERTDIYAVIDTNVVVSSLFSLDGTSCPAVVIYAIQHGGRIDPKTGILAKDYDTKNVTNDVTK